MMRSLDRLNPLQRRLVFFMFIIGGLLLLIGLTVLLASSAVNSGRPEAVAVAGGVTVTQFAALPDDDAFPPTVAAWDGGLYTGSYASGAIWFVDAAGQARELPNTRAAIGAVSGIVAASDGTLFVVDQDDTDTRSGGGDVKRVTPDGEVSVFAAIPDERGFIAPDDVALDSEGRVYVTDRGRNEVWRFDADGSNGVLWWTPTAEQGGAVTGLAYDAAADALLVTDPERNAIYRVTAADATAEVVYQSAPNVQNPPGFDGLTIAPDGTIYVAALGQNAVARIAGDTIDVIAANFRGASDVDYADGQLYVANWDQSSLVLPLVEPRLPFAIDVITLGDAE